MHGGLFVRCLVKALVKPCFSCDLKVITCKGRSGHAGLLSFHFFFRSYRTGDKTIIKLIDS